MSAKIYSVPSELKDVPNIFDYEDRKEYNKLIEQWYQGLRELCKKHNPCEDQRYIGEVVKWNVADGYAEYMVSALEDEDGEVELLHLPVMDEYEYGDADLQTAKRIKDKIDADKKFHDYLNRIPKVNEVNEVLNKVGVKTTHMPTDKISEFDTTTIGNRWFHIKWINETYMIPPFTGNTYGNNNHRVFKYLVNENSITSK